jgi:hypothetical protein
MTTMSKLLKFSPLFALLGLGACVTTPTGPSVLVLPGTGKSFEQFRADDSLCRQFASGQIGNTTAGDAAADSGVRSAAVGTAVGALAGAAIGGSRGAGVGAGAGLLMGSAEGSNASRRSGYTTQQRYDNSYIQCMYSYGHRVPVSGRLMTEPSHSTRPAPPPPPPGPPPPPPPSAR